MHCPSFQIVKYGVFDSQVRFAGVSQTPERPVTVFELEFYPAACPGETCLNGVWYPIRQDSFLCAKPGQTRRSRLPFRCNYFHLTTDDPELEALLYCLPDMGILPRMPEVTALFHTMLALDDPEPLASRLVLQSCICRIISLLTGSQVVDFPHRQTLLATESYIRDHLSERLSLTDLAAMANLSPYYFHRLFTEFFGKTPAQFILEQRIAAARVGLLKESYNLSQLAADCGFSSQSYFCCKFKQATGQTPLDYRRQMLSRWKI